MPPVPFVRDVPGLYPATGLPLPPGFSQVFILKGLKVLCFDTLLQVFILKVLTAARNFAHNLRQNYMSNAF